MHTSDEYDYKFFSEVLGIRCYGESEYDGRYDNDVDVKAAFAHKLNSFMAEGWPIDSMHNSTSAARSGGSGSIHMNWMTIILKKLRT